MFLDKRGRGTPRECGVLKIETNRSGRGGESADQLVKRARGRRGSARPCAPQVNQRAGEELWGRRDRGAREQYTAESSCVDLQSPTPP